MNKKVKFLIIVIVVFLVILFSPAQSADTDNVTGYAWSENIGWISFNCTNTDTCGTSDYGVNIETDGNLAGYAWSENIGWINFHPSGCCPQAPNNTVEYDSDTGQITGWARALSNGDGWDGWISFGKKSESWDDQVTINSGTGELSGWAWGDDVVGWISFNCIDTSICGTSNYRVIADINFPPSVSCNDSETWNSCSDSLNPFLSWNYSDSDSDPQESYQLQIDDKSNFNSPEIDTGVVNSSTDTYHSSGAVLDWDETYYWQIKVKDNQGAWSDWSSACSFIVPAHAYPAPGFTWSPLNLSALEPVQFTDNSICYDDIITGSACSSPDESFTWTIPKTQYADPLISTLENPMATFSDPGNWAVILEVTDDIGTCSINRTVNINEPLPEWIEVIPR